MFGNYKCDSIGMFSNYASKDGKGYHGDPSSLLTFYTSLGLYEDACRVVVAVLDGPDPKARRESAPSRMAHRGKADHVPIEKIDVLLNLMDISYQKGMFDAERMESICASREGLERALARYVELVKISVDGLPSANAMQL